MSVKREEVRELLPIGERVWCQCDGCGQKSASGNRRYETNETNAQYVTVHPPRGWLIISTPYDTFNDVASKHAHACERCKEMPASRLLEMAGIKE